MSDGYSFSYKDYTHKLLCPSGSDAQNVHVVCIQNISSKQITNDLLSVDLS